MKVSKFGGSSLANAGQFLKVLNIMKSDSERRVVVLSAPGTDLNNSIKITDSLIALASQQLRSATRSDIQVRDSLLKHIASICRDLELPELSLQCATHLDLALGSDLTDSDQFTDRVKSCGEVFSAMIFTALLRKNGFEARCLDPGEAGLLVEGHYGNARVHHQAYHEIAKLRGFDGILVIPGFYGRDVHGNIRTFSRGGSDISGAVFAAGLNAELYENWTDVNYVYAANPRIVNNPLPLEVLSCQEMYILASFGATVLHPDALEAVCRKNIPIRIANTDDPTCPGTWIGTSRQTSPNRVHAITSGGQQTAPTLSALADFPKNTKAHKQRFSRIIMLGETCEMNSALADEVLSCCEEHKVKVHELLMTEGVPALSLLLDSNAQVEAIRILYSHFIDVRPSS